MATRHSHVACDGIIRSRIWGVTGHAGPTASGERRIISCARDRHPQGRDAASRSSRDLQRLGERSE